MCKVISRQERRARLKQVQVPEYLVKKAKKYKLDIDSNPPRKFITDNLGELTIDEINKVDAQGYSQLFYMALYGRISDLNKHNERFRNLDQVIKRELFLTATNDFNVPILMAPILFGDIKTFRDIINIAGFDIKETKFPETNPRYKNMRIVDISLYLAVLNGHKDLFDSLLVKEGADLNVRFPDTHHLYKGLRIIDVMAFGASKAGDIDMLKILLFIGADLNVEVANNQTISQVAKDDKTRTLILQEITYRSNQQLPENIDKTLTADNVIAPIARAIRPMMPAALSNSQQAIDTDSMDPMRLSSSQQVINTNSMDPMRLSSSQQVSDTDSMDPEICPSPEQYDTTNDTELLNFLLSPLENATLGPIAQAEFFSSQQVSPSNRWQWNAPSFTAQAEFFSSPFRTMPYQTPPRLFSSQQIPSFQPQARMQPSVFSQPKQDNAYSDLMKRFEELKRKFDEQESSRKISELELTNKIERLESSNKIAALEMQNKVKRLESELEKVKKDLQQEKKKRKRDEQVGEVGNQKESEVLAILSDLASSSNVLPSSSSIRPDDTSNRERVAKRRKITNSEVNMGF